MASPKLLFCHFTANIQKIKCQHLHCFILAFSCRTKDHMSVSKIGASTERVQLWIVQKYQCLHVWPWILVRWSRGRIRNMTIMRTGTIETFRRGSYGWDQHVIFRSAWKSKSETMQMLTFNFLHIGSGNLQNNNFGDAITPLYEGHYVWLCAHIKLNISP